MQQRTFRRKTPVTMLATSIALALSAPLAAQEAGEAPAAIGQDIAELDKVTVTGYRQSLQKSLTTGKDTQERRHDGSMRMSGPFFSPPPITPT